MTNKEKVLEYFPSAHSVFKDERVEIRYVPEGSTVATAFAFSDTEEGAWEAAVHAGQMILHDRKCEELAQKYIGKAALEHGRSREDEYFRKEWYANRLVDVGYWVGQNSMRMRRCKRTDSEKYKEYLKIEQELEDVKFLLTQELLLIGGRYAAK